MRPSSLSRCAALVAVMLISSTCAFSDWTHQWLPSVWLADLDGDMTAGSAPLIQVDADFGDMFSDVDTGVALDYEGRVSDKIVKLEVATVELSSVGALSGASVDLDVGLITALVGLTIQEGNDPIDFMVGFRHVDTDFQAGGVISASASASWVDPVLALQMDTDLGDGVELALYADVGGFGAGSDMTWQVMPSARIHFTETFSALIAYRALAVESKDDEPLISDIMLRGWILGVGVSY